ncbi:non-specific lipid-transfer protein-like [Lycium barbarum]|uniref:non-specific lipid-transfer protein-like n=1 Tax=Lycium barbarum TaxID=112863 RepID=UPI00293F5DD5|nr:non-specific lipid-transfer protein-like [Lycium barbarum]
MSNKAKNFIALTINQHMKMKEAMLCSLIVLGFVGFVTMKNTIPLKSLICYQAQDLLSPCQPFLLGCCDNITAECCQGSQTLASLVKNSTIDDIRDLCKCLQKTGNSSSINVKKGRKLFKVCKIKRVPIGPKVDCDSI